MVGRKLSERHYKYLRGIVAGDGKIYGIPAWADSVLQCNPVTGKVKTLGRGTLPLGKWMWHGAALGLDGRGVVRMYAMLARSPASSSVGSLQAQ